MVGVCSSRATAGWNTPFTSVRMPEDEVVLGLVGRSLEQQLELTPDAVGHRDRTRRCPGLRSPEPALTFGRTTRTFCGARSTRQVILQDRTSFHSRRSTSRRVRAWAARTRIAGVWRQTGVVAASSRASSSARPRKRISRSSSSDEAGLSAARHGLGDSCRVQRATRTGSPGRLARRHPGRAVHAGPLARRTRRRHPAHPRSLRDRPEHPTVHRQRPCHGRRASPTPIDHREGREAVGGRRRRASRGHASSHSRSPAPATGAPPDVTWAGRAGHDAGAAEADQRTARPRRANPPAAVGTPSDLEPFVRPTHLRIFRGDLICDGPTSVKETLTFAACTAHSLRPSITASTTPTFAEALRLRRARQWCGVR